jgi:uncharacterized secreted protein with C-terminal beta-propeller domain
MFLKIIFSICTFKITLFKISNLNEPKFQSQISTNWSKFLSLGYYKDQKFNAIAQPSPLLIHWNSIVSILLLSMEYSISTFRSSCDVYQAYFAGYHNDASLW